MDFFPAVAAILLVPAAARAAIFWGKVFQQKEYRADRLRDFFAGREAARALRSAGFFWQIPILGAVFWGFSRGPGEDFLGGAREIFLANFRGGVVDFLAGRGGIDEFFLGIFGAAGRAAAPIFFETAAAGLFGFFAIFEGVRAVRAFARRRVPAPKLTARMAMIFAAAGGIFAAGILSAIFFTKIPAVPAIAAGLAIFLPAAPVVFLAANLAVWPIAAGLRGRAIRAGILARAGLPGLRAVVVAGSFGKSSTKEILAGLLVGAGLRGVVKTEKNENTEIALAAAALRLPRDARVWVAEAGAYGRGEIALEAKIIRPSVAIVTGLDDAHLTLFGAREIQTAAKFEAVDALPPGGILLANGDDPRVRGEVARRVAAGTLRRPGGNSAAGDFDKKSPAGGENFAAGESAPTAFFYGFSAENDFRAAGLRLGPGGWEFRWESDFFVAPIAIRTGFFARGLVQNLTGALGVAVALGADPARLAAAAPGLENPPRVFAPIPVGAGLVLDDAYNANPTGVRAAAEVLREIPREKTAVILDDVLEIGAGARDFHREIGRILAGIPSLRWVGLVGRDFAGEVRAGLAAGGFPGKILTDPAGIRAARDCALENGAAIIFEGKRAGEFLPGGEKN